jgi:hypothetical protein
MTDFCKISEKRDVDLQVRDRLLLNRIEIDCLHTRYENYSKKSVRQDGVGRFAASLIENL